MAMKAKSLTIKWFNVSLREGTFLQRCNQHILTGMVIIWSQEININDNPMQTIIALNNYS